MRRRSVAQALMAAGVAGLLLYVLLGLSARGMTSRTVLLVAAPVVLASGVALYLLSAERNKL